MNDLDIDLARNTNTPWVDMSAWSSLVSIGPAVWPAIRNKQTDKHIRFYYIDVTTSEMFCKFLTLKRLQKCYKAFAKHLCKCFSMLNCKIKHLKNICKNVLEPREVDGSKTFLQMFILHVATVYLQAVFDPAKMFCKCLGVKHFKNNFRGGYM